ncbi:hypothetical protein F3Y22_tig00111059pilonHSYRG00181 [Hibiscus syriacus]|uniref:FCP1 homology domain-containing protein n=1 Tax=Hibiscus syriacus TaxID=106335 RepID=A0A6A2Z3R4_HIBSY|nr:hypothetical protein F3Y22_tig00111059pilonHSYRG00181 [Hibiscus syriacus]
MAPKRQRQKRGLSQISSQPTSSQPSSSQPQPPSQTIAPSEEIRSFETNNFRSDAEKERWQRSFKVRNIRPECLIDLGFLFDDKYDFSFKSTFTSWGWLEFLGVEPKYYPNLVRVFYNNASFEYEPNKRYDFVEKVSWKRAKDVRLDLEREDNEDDQPMGDAMMEEAPEAQVGQDVTITTVMEYIVNFWEHIDSLVNGMRADISSLRDEVSMLRDELRQRHQTNVDNQAVNKDDDEDDDDDDPNKYIVSTTPLARKLVIFDVNGVLAYIPRHPEGFNSVNLYPLF